MSGFQEILVILLIVLGILFLPRRVSNRRETAAGSQPKVSGKVRAAVAVSLVYLALVAAWTRPWRDDPVAFLYIGAGPVVLIGLAFWVYAGFKNR